MTTKRLPDDPTQAVWVALVRASTTVIAAVQADMKAAGFPPLEWYDVLWVLEMSGGKRRPYELEETLLLAQYNLSRLVARMERAGYVAKLRCPEDGRGLVLAITDDGRDLRKRMWTTCFDSLKRHIGAKLSEDEARALAEMLLRCWDRHESGRQASTCAADPSPP